MLWFSKMEDQKLTDPTTQNEPVLTSISIGFEFLVLIDSLAPRLSVLPNRFYESER